MIYLDNAATSFPKPDEVYRGMDAFVRAAGANPGRGGHRLALEAEAMIEETRRLAAELFGAPRPERVVFALNATDALNMAIKGVVSLGDHVITSVLEHNSVSRPLNALQRRGLISLTRLPATSDHVIDPDALAAAWTPRTRLVVLTHASNVTGTIQPVREYGAIVRERDGLLVVDAAQSAGLVPIDVDADLIDLLAFTGHKGLLGPTGTGGLVAGARVDIEPWREGGTGGDSTNPFQPDEFPHHLEGGTPNVFGIAGLREGLRLLLARGTGPILDHERRLLAALLEAIEAPEAFSFYGGAEAFRERGGEGRVGLLSFNLAGFSAHELAAVLDEHYDIAVRSGLFCAPYAHEHLGTSPEGAVRISVGALSTPEDVLGAAAALNELAAG